LDILNNSSSDGNITGEWAFVINIGSFNSLSRGLEAQTNIFVVSETLGGLGSEDLLAAEGNTVLFVIESLERVIRMVVRSIKEKNMELR